MRSGWLRGLFILVLVFAVGTIGYAIGVSQGPGPVDGTMAYTGHWHTGPWFFPPFHFLGFFLFLFVFLAVMRALFAPWGMRGWGGPGPWGPLPGGPEGPRTRFDELHRRSHERIDSGESTSSASSNSTRTDAGGEPPAAGQ